MAFEINKIKFEKVKNFLACNVHLIIVLKVL